MRLIRGDCAVALLEVEPRHLASLQAHLRAQPEVEVVRLSGRPGAGEQGVWDLLQVAAASGGALAVALGVLPAFLQSRSREVTVTVKIGEGEDRKEVAITARNAEDAMGLLKRVLDG